MASTVPNSPTSNLTTPGGGFVSTDPAVQARLIAMGARGASADSQVQTLAQSMISPGTVVGGAYSQDPRGFQTQFQAYTNPPATARDTISQMVTSPSSGSTITSEPYRSRIEDANQQVQSRINSPLSTTHEYRGGTSAGQNNDLNRTVQGAEEFNQAQVEEDPLYKLIGQRREQLRLENQQLTDSIRANFENRLTATKEDQRAETGMNAMALARGGALGTSGSGIAFMNKLEISHRSELNTLETQRNDALRLAAQAASKEDFELLGKMVDRADSLEKSFNEAQQRRVDNLLKYKQIEKIEKDELSDTLSSLAAAGKTLADLPDGYLEFQEKASGLSPGTGRFVFEAAQKEQALKAKKDDLAMRKDEAALKRETYDIASQIIDIQSKVPRGQPVKIGDATYYGIGTGHLKTGIEVDETGESVYYEFDPYTKTMNTYATGIHKQQDGWKMVFDGQGRPFWANENTRQLEYAGQPSAWQQTLPEGSVGGQCGQFYNKLTGLGVGDSIESKLKFADKSITPDTLRVGDGFVSDEGGWTGHIGFVNNITDVGGRKLLTLTESNYKRDERVTHTRQIFADDPRLKGFIPSADKINPALRTGTDTPNAPGRITFAPKPTDAPESPPVKKINGVDQQWDAASQTWKPIVSSAPQNEAANQMVNDALETIRAIRDSKGLAGAVGAKGPTSLFGYLDKPMPGTEAAGAVVQIDRLKSLLALENLKYLKGLGAMSDREFAVIQSVSSALSRDMTEKSFKEELTRLETVLKNRTSSTPASTSQGSGKLRSPDGTTYEYDLSDPEQKAEYYQAVAANWQPL